MTFLHFGSSPSSSPDVCRPLRRRFRAETLALALCVGGAPLACGGDDPTATEENASIQVSVVAQQDAVPGVAVSLTAPGDSEALAAVSTDDQGVATFSRLEPGIYDVVVAPPGTYQPAPGHALRTPVTAEDDATSELRLPLIPEFGAVADLEGTVYRTVLIGSQTWTVDNLRTVQFRNGDSIPEARTESEWRTAWETESPAWVTYGNDPDNADAYGRLYNNFAASDPRGLCPEGWHVPTEGEWQGLELFIGMPASELTDQERYRGDVGRKLKSLRAEPDPHPRWTGQNSRATNETGFSSLPNGFRVGSPVGDWVAGSFERLGEEANYWTSTAATGGHWGRAIPYTQDGIFRGATTGWGFAVRCVAD